MKKCCECQQTLVSPRQVHLCEDCFQEMLEYKLDTLGETKEVVKV
jgi:hypothetical protein